MPIANTFTKFWEVRPTSGMSINQKDYQVAANTTINEGDLVTVSSGLVTQAMAANATANSANAAYANGAIVGVALASITTTGSSETTTGRTTIPVAILDDNCEVAYRLWNATPGDSELQDVAIGTAYAPMRWTSSPNTITWYAISTSTTNGAFILTEKSVGSNATDDYGVGWFKLAPGYRVG